MTWGMVFNIMRYSINDGPGIRTTVFLKGCPLDCWWCHNPESKAAGFQLLHRQDRCIRCGACVRACPQNTLAEEAPRAEGCIACGKCADACGSGAREGAGRRMTPGQVMAEIEKDVIFYDQSGGGVTFSGGEPLRQEVFLRSLLTECRKKEISTAVDTSGFGPFAYLREIAADVDLFLYDLKIMDEAQHRQYTGMPNKAILQNLQGLAAIHSNIIVRFPVIPGYTDSSENIACLGEFLRNLPVKGIEPVPYHKIGSEKYRRLNMEYKLRDLQPPHEESMRRAREQLKEYHLNIIEGGSSDEGSG